MVRYFRPLEVKTEGRAESAGRPVVDQHSQGQRHGGLSAGRVPRVLTGERAVGLESLTLFQGNAVLYIYMLYILYMYILYHVNINAE